MNDMIERIREHYDADHDSMPGLPRVTWADNEILDILERQQAEIETLKAQISEKTSDKAGRGAQYSRAKGTLEKLYVCRWCMGCTFEPALNNFGQPRCPYCDSGNDMDVYTVGELGHHLNAAKFIHNMLTSCDFALVGCSCMPSARMEYDSKQGCFVVFAHEQTSMHIVFTEAVKVFADTTDH